MRKRHFVYKIFRKKTIKRVENKIKLLGNFDLSIEDYLLIRLMMSTMVFIIFFLMTKYSFLAPLMTVLFYIFFEKIILDYQIKKREKLIEKEAIFFFQIVNLTLESSRNLKYAIEITSKTVNGELSSEFKKAFGEMKLGKSFNEALKAMKERIPSENVNSIILNLTESAIFGSSIISTINNQIEYIEEKQLLEVKALINKLPTKISIISVLFFIPIMLLIILAPVILQYFG